MSEFVFFVAGTPIPQGSKSAKVIRGKAIMFEQNKSLTFWRAQVTKVAAARRLLDEWDPIPDVHARLLFKMPRPVSVTRPFPTVAPDLDKLVRAVFDAMTSAHVITDDSTITQLTAGKVYAGRDETPGVAVTLRVPMRKV